MQDHQRIRETIEGLLKAMGIGFEEILISDVDGRTAFIIKSPESHILIGTRGAHISALNHIIKRIAGKSVPPDAALDFYVDVNDYHEKLLREIRNKATILAERARSFKTTVEMDPMSSYERMVIHTFFEDVSDIETESRGTGANRHIVLKYVGDEPAL